MTRTPLVLLAAIALSTAFLGGCGSSDDDSIDSGKGTLIVLGASSLTTAVTEYGESFPRADVKESFAGSDELAAQIQQGAKADVFASADTGYPAQLYGEGLAEKPRVFAANELVIAVPDNSDISSLEDLTKPGVKLVIGDPSVPVGDYTRTVLSGLPPAESKAILANVRSEETEVSSVVAKLEQGAADAGFVYVTDQKAAEGLKAVPIPPSLQPDVAYAAAVVKSSDNKPAAKEFLNGLIEGEGAEDLRRAGFLPPP